ncbi:MAG: undecaprenyl-phosphate glucose phosphotransferase [Methanobacteriaceae archaeon]|jgi:Undecaprenyl-phosphate glucose phosphotransferase|nr:undecaprenyl-phosphate glucose phosphotransferase [Methanobacteriaceae archaeon]
MIRENQKYFNLILIVADSSVIIISLILAWYLRFRTTILGDVGVSGWGFTEYMIPLVVIIPLYLVLYYIFALYRPQRTSTLISEIGDIIKANFTGLVVLTALLYLISADDYSRYVLLVFAIFTTLFTVTERMVVRNSLRIIRSKGYNLKHVLVVGAGELGLKFARRIDENQHIGYHIIGFLDDNLEKGHKILNSEVIGKIKDLEHFVFTEPLDRVVITLSPRDYNILEIVDVCEKHGVKAVIIPEFSRYFPARPNIDMLDDMPIIDIRYIPLDNVYKKFLKRIFDCIAATLAIIILSPIIIVTAVLVKLSSPGSIIYKQERVGLNRKKFQIYKFRSMETHDETKIAPRWTTEDDPRKTTIGSFIRRTSIDEFPQFFNILRGDMSLIGPRPERPVFVEMFREQIPKYMIKHYVRPGMTGWAQVNGWRGNTSIEKRIEHDIYYVENWTIFLDLKIFFLTFIRGFVNKNAY